MNRVTLPDIEGIREAAHKHFGSKAIGGMKVGSFDSQAVEGIAQPYGRAAHSVITEVGFSKLLQAGLRTAMRMSSVEVFRQGGNDEIELGGAFRVNALNFAEELGFDIARSPRLRLGIDSIPASRSVEMTQSR